MKTHRQLFLIVSLFASTAGAAETSGFVNAIPVLKSLKDWGACIDYKDADLCTRTPMVVEAFKENLGKGWKYQDTLDSSKPGSTVLSFKGLWHEKTYGIIYTKVDGETQAKVYVLPPSLFDKLNHALDYKEASDYIFGLYKASEGNKIDANYVPVFDSCLHYKAKFSGLVHPIKNQKIVTCWVKETKTKTYIALSTDKGLKMFFDSDHIEDVDKLPDPTSLK